MRLRLAQELSDPQTLAQALSWADSVRLARREAQAAQELTEISIRLSTEQGFAYWLACATLRRGVALVVQGQAEEGISQMRQGLATVQATATQVLNLY